MDTPTKLASGEERSYVRTAWKSVMATKTALLFVVLWLGMIRPRTSVCCVDSLDIPWYSVRVCNTHSNSLQERLATVYPHTSLRLARSHLSGYSNLGDSKVSEGVMLHFGHTVTLMRLNMAEREPQNKQNVSEGFMRGLISRSSY